MPTIHPHLWFDREAEEAARFYVSIFKDATITSTTRLGSKNEANPLTIVQFELQGLPYTAINAGPEHRFNESVSFMVSTKDQEETDYYWNALQADGGYPQPCGWIKDKFGVSWQVTPAILPKYVADPDHARRDRVLKKFFAMERIIIADLEKAYAGK
jgi:predicted 3-demethylubiquinone-9 3-methyltransferase (glyoxalase superfamily)